LRLPDFPGSAAIINNTRATRRFRAKRKKPAGGLRSNGRLSGALRRDRIKPFESAVQRGADFGLGVTHPSDSILAHTIRNEFQEGN
jgi:hypothetical protein